MGEGVGRKLTSKVKQTKYHMTQKRGVRYPKLYTGKLFLETSPKLKAAFNLYFDAGYRQLYLIEMLKDIDMGIDLLPNSKITHTTEDLHSVSNLCVDTSITVQYVGSIMSLEETLYMNTQCTWPHS